MIVSRRTAAKARRRRTIARRQSGRNRRIFGIDAPQSARPATKITSAERAATRFHGTEEEMTPPRLRAAHPVIRRSSCLRVGQLFSHLDQKLTCLAALDLVEGLHDADRT